MNSPQCKGGLVKGNHIWRAGSKKIMDPQLSTLPVAYTSSKMSSLPDSRCDFFVILISQFVLTTTIAPCFRTAILLDGSDYRHNLDTSVNDLRRMGITILGGFLFSQSSRHS